MRALSIRQPWAWLIVNGFKDVENRTWKTKYRGEVLIHASKTYDKVDYNYLKSMIGSESVDKLLLAGLHPEKFLGGIIGKVEITDCVEQCNSKWFHGPYGFIVKNQQVLPFYPYKGKLGLFKIDQPTETRYK